MVLTWPKSQKYAFNSTLSTFSDSFLKILSKYEELQSGYDKLLNDCNGLVLTAKKLREDKKNLEKNLADINEKINYFENKKTEVSIVETYATKHHQQILKALNQKCLIVFHSQASQCIELVKDSVNVLSDGKKKNHYQRSEINVVQNHFYVLESQKLLKYLRLVLKECSLTELDIDCVVSAVKIRCCLTRARYIIENTVGGVYHAKLALEIFRFTKSLISWFPNFQAMQSENQKELQTESQTVIDICQQFNKLLGLDADIIRDQIENFRVLNSKFIVSKYKPCDSFSLIASIISYNIREILKILHSNEFSDVSRLFENLCFEKCSELLSELSSKKLDKFVLKDEQLQTLHSFSQETSGLVKVLKSFDKSRHVPVCQDISNKFQDLHGPVIEILKSAQNLELPIKESRKQFSLWPNILNNKISEFFRVLEDYLMETGPSGQKSKEINKLHELESQNSKKVKTIDYLKQLMLQKDEKYNELSKDVSRITKS
ncbi:hypothetical protein RF11_09738 [Thelohanellus kitauei]|uniref:Uncharacterized protein n=1 Tax=Thelohanellus kitauei TaxID=669202 RepID=A0A0C2IN85_THEKT|nr:hypothetical protein RF11_09738 [Thelohanellus kitauei]